MSTANLLLIVMTLLVSGMASLFFLAELIPMVRDHARQPRAALVTGDSSLSPRSINWLAAVAFIGAVFICFVLV